MYTTISRIKQLLTHFFHFNEESINIVPGIVRVNVLLMALYFLIDEPTECFVMFKYFVVRTRQDLHNCREWVVHLCNRNEAIRKACCYWLNWEQRLLKQTNPDEKLTRFSLTYKAPHWSLQMDKFRDFLLTCLEYMVTVIKSFCHPQLTNDIRCSIVEKFCRAKRFSWWMKDQIVKTLFRQLKSLINPFKCTGVTFRHLYLL